MLLPPGPTFRERLMRAWHERAVALKALSFAFVGVINSAIDFAIFSFCYYYLDLPLIVSNTAAWFVAVSGSYVLNSTITFARESGASPKNAVAPAIFDNRVLRKTSAR